MVDVAGKEDAVVKREKHSSFVYAENVELLPTKVVKPEAPKETLHFKRAYLQFRLGKQNHNIHFTRYESPSAFRIAGAFIPRFT